jgi:threonylcarbamoyladenosine tRNA methylthiotransferase MtaB
LRRHLDAEVGKTLRVLAESEAQGRTEQYLPVKFSRSAAPGAIVNLKIGGHDGERLLAA